MPNQAECIEVIEFNPELDVIDICDLCAGNAESTEVFNQPCPIDGGMCKLDKPVELSYHR